MSQSNKGPQLTGNQVLNEWSLVRPKLATILPEDLFLLSVKAVELSPFVKSVVCKEYAAFAQTLVWHVNQSSRNIELQLKGHLATEFKAFTHAPDQLASEPILMQKLRQVRRLHSAAIATLELTQAIHVESSSLRISVLADSLVSIAYQWCYTSLSQLYGVPCSSVTNASQASSSRELELLILAMGKLGGKELNFSSDIDLIFFYPDDGNTQGGKRSIDNARFFRRLSTQLIKVLDEPTADGFVFRVDMRLRPYGDSGALVMSLGQAEEYYQEQGREWERFAMLRARAITGCKQDIKTLETIIQPFSFRRYIDYGVIDSIRNMKQMIQREVKRKGLVDNIKLGAGGIREVEFIIQSLQLIQGGRDIRLREPNTFKVVPYLVDAKLLPQQTADELLQAYRFLRRLEHWIQSLYEKQTQQLPQDSQSQAALVEALQCGSWENLIEQLAAHQKKVNLHFSELLGEERQQGLARDDFYQSLADGHIEAEQLVEKLKDSQAEPLSLDDCQLFINTVDKFLSDSNVNNLSSRGAKRLKKFFPALLSTCLSSDAPNQTLTRLLKLIYSILKRTAYLELLSENPPILQHLVDLAGQSDWVVKRLSEFPVLIDELLYPNSLYEPLQGTDLKAELRQALLRIDSQDEELLLDTLRSFKQINELRVAAALLSQRLSISQVSRYLTQLAEVILQVSVEQCWRLLSEQYGVPEGLNDDAGGMGFAVIGYGKLGGVELGFGSDLDLVFLFDQPVEEKTSGKRSIQNSRFYTRLAQKLIHFLSITTNQGQLYEVDMRLRPSGASGLLVSHIEAYCDYQKESAWTWEHQALVRARYVAGDPKIIDAFAKIRQQTLATKRDTKTLAADVAKMRDKMRSQLERKKTGFIDLKQSVGGLVDIEFLAQYFVLSLYSQSAIAQKDQVAIPYNMVDCLQVSQAYDLLSLEDASFLVKTYRQFRNRLNENALLDKGSLVANEKYATTAKKVELIWKTYLSN
ncbi:bifunctional [glutamate--ammonia ligase]-adenylyl-L-tyrosine phosphorylase/[glutamate--ammonia-ligase] adenylyltransferase [Aliikangiella sp. IMCC44653]